TRDTGQLRATAGEATADLHLLELPDRLVVVGQVRAEHEGRDELLPRQAGAIFEQVAAATHHALDALQVALPANVRLQIAGEVLGAHDGVIDFPLGLAAGSAFGDVQCARPMAALAADAHLARKEWRAVTILAAADRFDAIGMADQARGDDGAAAAVLQLVLRRKVPAAAARAKPAHRRLPDGALLNAEIGASARAGTDGDVGRDCVARRRA